MTGCRLQGLGGSGTNREMACWLVQRRKVAPPARLDPALLQEQIAEVVKHQGEAIFAQLSEAARQQLHREGLKINERVAHLERINEATRELGILSIRS